MSTSFKTSMFGGFDRSDVIAYIEKTGREHEERVAALEAENETLRKENQTLENTQRVTQAQLLKMRDNEETCRRLRRQLADAEARNQELEQRCAQLKVQADEYESLKDHVAQIEISAHRRTEQFREEAVTRLRQLAARQREWCRTAQADYEQMNRQLLERLQQAEQTLRQPDMSSFRRMEEGLTGVGKGPDGAGRKPGNKDRWGAFGGMLLFLWKIAIDRQRRHDKMALQSKGRWCKPAEMRRIAVRSLEPDPGNAGVGMRS